MSDLIAVGYDDVETAETVREKLLELQSRRVITLEDAVVVERTLDGKIKLHQARSAAAAGAVGGALWGGLIGLLFFMPFLGAAVGAAAGAASGSMIDMGVDDNFMREVGEELSPGRAALFVLVVSSTPEKVIPEVAPYGGHIITTSLSSEAEAHLRETARAARVAQGGPAGPAPEEIRGSAYYSG
jgi:uncharacterized membrane protein